MKKLIAMLLAIVMVMSLAACGGPAEPPTDPPAVEDPSTVTDAPAIEAPAEPLTNAERYPLDSDIVFDVIVNNETSYAFKDRALPQMWERVTGVEINWLDMTHENYSLYMAGGDWPDACFFETGLDKATIYEYGSAGKLVNFADYLNIMPNFCRVLEEFPDARSMCQNADGSIYSLPHVMLAPTSSNPVYIRTDMLKQAGWDEIPKTTDEFLQCMKDVQATYGEDPEFIAFMCHSIAHTKYTGAIAKNIFPAFGELLHIGLTVDSNDKVVLGAASEQYKHYLEFMIELYNADVFYKDAFTADTAYTAGIITGNKTCVATTMTSLTKDNFASGEFEFTVLPPLTSEYYSEQHAAINSPVKWNNSWISTECEDVETMIKWFDSFFAPEDDPLNEEGTIWSVSASMGELGVDWERIDDVYYRTMPKEGYDDPLIWKNENELGYHFSGVGTQIEDNGTALAVKAAGTIQNLYPYGQDYVDLTALTLSEDDQDDYATYWTDIDTYINDCFAKFVTGQEDLETGWDAYLANLERMGMNEVLDIYQRTYDATK